jgi:hypothetical protein
MRVAAGRNKRVKKRMRRVPFWKERSALWQDEIIDRDDR